MTMKIILDIVCKSLNINPCLVLQGRKVTGSRKREKVYARQMCMVFAREYGLGTLEQVGREYGNYDHASVLHALKSIQNDCDTNKCKRAKYEEIKDLLDEYEHPDVDLEYIELTPEALSYQTNQTKLINPVKEIAEVHFVEPARYREYSRI